MDKLEQELRTKLPPEQIKVLEEEGVVLYYDYHGVTFRESNAEQRIVENYIIGVIEAKVGYRIRITEWGLSSNGHFVHFFERA